MTTAHDGQHTSDNSVDRRSRVARRYEAGLVGLLATVLEDSPRLPKAACLDRSALFDPATADEHPDDVAYRYAAAARICSSCPALTDCWAYTSTPAAHRVAGYLPGRSIAAVTPPRMSA